MKQFTHTWIAALFAVSGVARAQGSAAEKPTAPPAPLSASARIAPGFVPDAVYLKNGGLVRGAVLESLPGDHVTMAIPTGEVRRIPWTDVDRVMTSTVPGASPAAVPHPPPPAPKQGPLVRVHITTDQNVLLDRRPEGSETWVPACAAPCDEDFPLADEYRLSGPGLRSTGEFRLQGSPGGRVDLSVSPATKTAWWVGAGVGGMGLVIDVYALYIALFGSMLENACHPGDSYYPRSCSTSSSGTTLRNVGLIMLIPGPAAAIVGGAMMFANWRTGIRQTPGDGQSAGAKTLDAFKRSGEWKARDTTAPDALPALWVPLASGKF